MKKIALVAAIAAIFAAPAMAVTATSVDTGAGSVSTATAVAGPGNGAAVTTTSGNQFSNATVNAASVTVPGLLTANHVDGSTVAGGNSTSFSASTGNAGAASTTAGHSGANSAALAAGATVSNGQPVAGVVVGAAQSRNTNISSTISVGNGVAFAAQASGNASSYDGNSFALRAGNFNFVHTDGTATSAGAAPVNVAVAAGSAAAANGPLANTGFGTVTGVAVAGNLVAVTP